MTRDPAQDNATVALVLDQLDPLPIIVRRLFGGYSLYLGDKLPAFVMDDTVCLKITEYADDRLIDDYKGEIYPGSKDYWRLPGDLLEDRDWLQHAFTETAARIAPPKPRKRR
jgi:TfoX/Sxy family transcriptional regulator of competence genes